MAGGRGQGWMGGSGFGPGGDCQCPQCGNTLPHQVGVPCYQQTCPNCGSKMMRPPETVCKKKYLGGDERNGWM